MKQKENQDFIKALIELDAKIRESIAIAEEARLALRKLKVIKIINEKRS